MKKFIMFCSFIFVCVLALTLFCTQNVGKEQVRAKSLTNDKMLIVVGFGEVEVMPDTIQVNFGLRTRADTLIDGQTKMKESIDNISSKLKEFDKDSSVYITYSSSYPVSEGGILVYEFDCNLVVKSTKVDNSNDLIDVLVNAGATSVHHASYSLTNKEDSYVQALVKAKDNANKKVEAMYTNAQFKGLKEENVYNYCESSRGEKIKVCAKVKAFYELNDAETSQKVEETNKTETEKTTTITTNNQNARTNTENKEESSKTSEKETTNVEAAEEAQNTNNESQDKLSNNTIITADDTIVRLDNSYNANNLMSTLEEKDAV